MPDLQSPDPGRKLQQKYNLIGSTPAPFLSPELVPVVLIDDLSDQEPGVLFASAGEIQVNVVGQQSQTSLSSKTGSNVILSDVVLRFSSENIGRWELSTGGPALSTGVTELWQDRRRPGSPAGVVTRGTDIGATSGPVAKGRILAATMHEILLPNWVLTETDKLHFLMVVVNNTITFQWMWSESPA